MPSATAQYFVSGYTIVRAESQPGCEVGLGFPSPHVQPYFTYNRLASHNIDTVNARQVHTSDALKFTPEIKLRSILSGWLGFFHLGLASRGLLHRIMEMIGKTGQVLLQLLITLADSPLVG